MSAGEDQASGPDVLVSSNPLWSRGVYLLRLERPGQPPATTRVTVLR